MDSVTPEAPKRPKTKPKGRHPHHALAAAFVRSAPVGRHADGNGLYLYVQRTGTRSWIQRLVIRGRKHELGLGSVHLVSLAEAREQALANRKLARSGGDPLADKRRVQGMPTFAEAAAAVVEQKRAGWRSPRQAAGWLNNLERYVFPRIGSRPVSEVNSADVLAILGPLWHVKMRTARTLRQRIRAVLEWSIAMEHRTDNPCDRIGPVLGPQREVVRHMRALPHREVAAAVDTVRASSATRAVKVVFELLVLTAPPQYLKNIIFNNAYDTFDDLVPHSVPHKTNETAWHDRRRLRTDLDQACRSASPVVRPATSRPQGRRVISVVDATASSSAEVTARRPCWPACSPRCTPVPSRIPVGRSRPPTPGTSWAGPLVKLAVRGS